MGENQGASPEHSGIVLSPSVSLKSATFLPWGSMMTTAISIIHSLFSIQGPSVTSNQEQP